MDSLEQNVEEIRIRLQLHASYVHPAQGDTKIREHVEQTRYRDHVDNQTAVRRSWPGYQDC